MLVYVHVCTYFHRHVYEQVQYTYACQILPFLEMTFASAVTPGKSCLLWTVIPLLQSLLTDESPLEVYQSSLKAFSRWVDFGLAIDRSEPIIQQVRGAGCWDFVLCQVCSTRIWHLSRKIHLLTLIPLELHTLLSVVILNVYWEL